MARSRIVINGVTGSYFEVPVGSQVQLNNDGDGGESSILWTAVTGSQPSGSYDGFSSSTSFSPTITVNKEGNYLVRNTVDGDSSLTSSAVISVLHQRSSVQSPAAGEKLERSGSFGWARAIQRFGDIIDDLVGDDAFVVGLAKEDLQRGQLVRPSGSLRVKVGLPGEQRVMEFSRVAGEATGSFQGTLYIVEGTSLTGSDIRVSGSAPEPGDPTSGSFFIARRVGLFGPITGSAVLGDFVWPRSDGVISPSLDAVDRKIGTVISVDAGNSAYFVHFDGSSDLRPGSGGSSGITFQEDGSDVTNTPHSTVNFTGSGGIAVSLTDSGSGAVLVDISGSTSGGSTTTTQYVTSGLEFLDLIEVTGSVNSVIFSGSEGDGQEGVDLDGDVDEEYIISYYCPAPGGSGASYSVRPNSLAPSEMVSARHFAGFSESDAISRSWVFASGSSTNRACEGEIKIRAKAGKPRSYTSFGTLGDIPDSVTAIWKDVYAGWWDDTATKITSLQIFCTDTAIHSGSRFGLWRKRAISTARALPLEIQLTGSTITTSGSVLNFTGSVDVQNSGGETIISTGRVHLDQISITAATSSVVLDVSAAPAAARYINVEARILHGQAGTIRDFIVLPNGFLNSTPCSFNSDQNGADNQFNRTNYMMQTTALDYVKAEVDIDYQIKYGGVALHRQLRGHAHADDEPLGKLTANKSEASAFWSDLSSSLVTVEIRSTTSDTPGTKQDSLGSGSYFVAYAIL